MCCSGMRSRLMAFPNLSEPSARMGLCLRPLRLRCRWGGLASVLRCCLGSCRSWRVSAMPLMGASWRLWRSWTVTGCVVLPGRGRSRRWWPGSWAPRRATPPPSPRSRTGWPGFPAAPKGCGRVGCRWIRSGSSPRAPLMALMSIMRNSPGSPRSLSCTRRSNWNPAPNPNPMPARAAAGAAGFDQPNL